VQKSNTLIFIFTKVKKLYICRIVFLLAALFNTREGVSMKDFILGGILGFVIVAFVITVYGFRIGVYTL
jgi:hypothetical protein